MTLMVPVGERRTSGSLDVAPVDCTGSAPELSARPMVIDPKPSSISAISVLQPTK